jgi:type II secretory pathway predicted ATPase ExeA
MSERTSQPPARLAASPSERAEARGALTDYLQRTGASVDDFARRIGFAPNTLRLFLSDKYHVRLAESSHRIYCAITSFIAANPIRPAAQPFGLLYETANMRAIRQTFEALLRRPVAYMIYAPPGSQKSFVLEHLVAELNQREMAAGGNRRAFYVYGRVKASPSQVMKQVAIACGVSSTGDGLRIMQNLSFEFRERRVLLVVDEAQHLSLDCFEALRELLDRPPHFSLLFSGSHDLKAIFDRWSATLEQWNSRMVDKIRLPGIDRQEAEAIVEREIGDWLRSLPNDSARAQKIDHLINGAISEDAFDKRRRYINVRTLSNALDQVKLRLEASRQKLQ